MGSSTSLTLVNIFFDETEVREKAGDSLVKLLKDAKLQKKPECRAIVERRSSEVLFCPDSRTRKDLTDFLFRNQNLEDVLPTDLQTEYLTSTYRIQTLEIKSISVHETSASFVNYGMFQRRKVIWQWMTLFRVRTNDKGCGTTLTLQVSNPFGLWCPLQRLVIVIWS